MRLLENDFFITFLGNWYLQNIDIDNYIELDN